MPPQELRGLIRARPFVPFRLTLTDGRKFDVHHPDLVIVGTGVVIIGIPQAGTEDPFMERSITVSLLHVVSTEPLAATAPTKGNGAA